MNPLDSTLKSPVVNSYRKVYPFGKKSCDAIDANEGRFESYAIYFSRVFFSFNSLRLRVRKIGGGVTTKTSPNHVTTWFSWK